MKNGEDLWLVCLTNSEKLALVDLLVEFSEDPRHHGRTFLDLAADKTTTPNDLLRILDRARWFPAEIQKRINNYGQENPAPRKS
jgi:hypothetical protein